MTNIMENLLNQWERRCDTLTTMVAEAEIGSSQRTIAGLYGKLGMCRSMTIELERAIREQGE